MSWMGVDSDGRGRRLEKPCPWESKSYSYTDLRLVLVLQGPRDTDNELLRHYLPLGSLRIPASKVDSIVIWEEGRSHLCILPLRDRAVYEHVEMY
jgi:hypothetical protein